MSGVYCYKVSFHLKLQFGVLISILQLPLCSGTIKPKLGLKIEFQNLFVNGEKYPEDFIVKAQSGERLWSGRSGIGK